MTEPPAPALLKQRATADRTSDSAEATTVVRMTIGRERLGALASLPNAHVYVNG